MFLYSRVTVGDRERVLVSRKGRFDRVLSPGVHNLFGSGIEKEYHAVDEACFASPWTNFLLDERPDLVASHFYVVETKAKEVALIRRNGKIERIQGPGERTLVWKTAARMVVDILDTAANPIAPRALTAELMRFGVNPAYGQVLIEEGRCGLLFIDGAFHATLTPGHYILWRTSGTPSVETIDLRTQPLEITGQEILTSDKVSIRVNVWAEYRVVDPLKSRQAMKAATDHLYKAVQLAVRQTLARRTLDEVLNSRTDVDEAVAGEVRTRALEYGVSVGTIAVKDIIPPGEVRDILNQVVTAEKRAQANLIARREETAATRNLLNTARIMAEHPLLIRMKELETLEKIATKVDKITIHGGTTPLLDQLIRLRDD